VSWNVLFSEPIVLTDGSELATLREAYDHLNEFSKSEQDAEEWKAAANYLIEAAERGGAVAFARLGTLRAIKQRSNGARMLELAAFTMREVEQLRNDQADPLLSVEEASPALPAVMEVLVDIVCSPAEPVQLNKPTLMQRKHESVEPKGEISIKPNNEKSLIVSETLQSAIAKAVRTAEPAFVDVIVQRISPKSRFDSNWDLRGIKFGKADREKANKAIMTVVERMQREFRLSED